MKKFRASLSPETEKEFNISASGGQCLEFNTPDVSKGAALTQLLDLLNIPANEAMVLAITTMTCRTLNCRRSSRSLWATLFRRSRSGLTT